jgi:DNA-binding transcriptional LysR family regulator
MLKPIDLSRVDLNLLVLFETVCAERHVGRSAARLNLTASAVSHGLKRLRRLLNDPLFLRTPKGVTPTERALDIEAPIAEILARVRSVVSTATPFVPKTSTRRFIVAAPDAVSAGILPTLMKAMRKSAPGIAIGVRQLLASQQESSSPQHPWRSAFSELDERKIDIAIVPTVDVPERFHAQRLYDEEFVLAMRPGHPYLRRPTLDHYCDVEHLVVSESGDPFGFVDSALARVNRSRRTALTVPHFMFALAVLANTDFVCAIPRAFAAQHAATFRVVTTKPPLCLPSFSLQAVAPKPAMMDAGVRWLVDLLQGSTTTAPTPRRKGAR